MSTSISLPQPWPLVKNNVAYSIQSSSSEKMRLIPIETQPRVNQCHYPNEVPAGTQPVNPHIIHEELVYHPPQSRFPIRICGVHGCGIILTRQKDGSRPLCHRHAIEIDMIRRGNPYPPSHTALSHLPPQPQSSSWHEKERERDIGLRHKLHALTPVQCSLLAQMDADFDTIDPRVLPNLPAPKIPCIAPPQPSKPPPVVTSYFPIPECLDAATIEAATWIAHRPAAAAESKVQNSRAPLARGSEYPLAGDASGRTIYIPHRASLDTARVSGPLHPIISPQIIRNRDPLIKQLDVVPPTKQPRAVFLNSGSSSLANEGYGIGQTSTLGKRKRRHGGPISGAVDERPRRREIQCSVSEPLSILSSTEMWEGDMDVDVKENKETLPMEFDLIAAIGNAIQNALSTLDLDGMELTYPEPVADTPVPQGHLDELELTYPEPVADAPVPQGHPDPNIFGKQENVASEVIDLTADGQSVGTSRTSTSPTESKHPYLATHMTHLNSEASQLPRISGQSSQSYLEHIYLPQSRSLFRISSASKLRTCSTPGCLGLIKSDTTTTRCYKCVMSQWKVRKEAALKPNNDSTSKPSTSGFKFNKQRKRVKWADGYKFSDKGNEMEEDEKRALEEDTRRDCIPCCDDLIDLEDSLEESSEDSSSSDTDNSSDEPEDSHTPSTGLKIRIPPRPRPLGVNTSPLASQGVEEDPPLVSVPPNEVSARQVSSSAPTEIAIAEDNTTLSPDQIRSSTPQVLPEKSPPITSAETWESDGKSTPFPRIRITLSQIFKLRASSSSASPGPMPSLSPIVSSSSSSNSSASPFPVPPPEYNPSGHTCVIRKCGRALPCHTHTREYQRKKLGRRERYVGNEYDHIKPIPTSPSEPANTFEPVLLRNFTMRGLKYKVFDIHHLLVPEARICAIRSCRHILPGIKDYRWKMCHRCRERTARTRRIRQIKTIPGGTVDPAVIEAEVPAPQPLLQDSSRISRGRCPNVDCGVKLEKGKEPTSDSLVECNQCLWRNLSPHERKYTYLSLHDQVLVVPRKPRNKGSSSNFQKNASNLYSRHNFPPEKPRPAAPYPEYLTLSQLLSNFHQHFSHFLQAQSYYVYYNEDTGGRNITKFSFDGEFSSVAPDLQVLKREKEVLETVENVKEEIERLGKLKFDPSSRATSVAYSGFITRYAYQNPVPISLPAPVPQPNLYLNMMGGGLEVAVLPVDTHRFLSGQRTVVRFRLVG